MGLLCTGCQTGVAAHALEVGVCCGEKYKTTFSTWHKERRGSDQNRWLSSSEDPVALQPCAGHCEHPADGSVFPEGIGSPRRGRGGRGGSQTQQLHFGRVRPGLSPAAPPERSLQNHDCPCPLDPSPKPRPRGSVGAAGGEGTHTHTPPRHRLSPPRGGKAGGPGDPAGWGGTASGSRARRGRGGSDSGRLRRAEIKAPPLPPSLPFSLVTFFFFSPSLPSTLPAK